MALLSNRSSHPVLSYTDGFAAGASDALLLVGRILLGWIFLSAGWGKFANLAGTTTYFTNLKMPAPQFFAYLSAVLETLMGAALILGIGTRYAALLVFVFVIIATALAHRYWEYPAAHQGNQYNHMVKNIAIMGGALALFVTGAGRFSLDAMLGRHR